MYGGECGAVSQSQEVTGYEYKEFIEGDKVHTGMYTATVVERRKDDVGRTMYKIVYDDDSAGWWYPNQMELVSHAEGYTLFEHCPMCDQPSVGPCLIHR